MILSQTKVVSRVTHKTCNKPAPMQLPTLLLLSLKLIGEGVSFENFLGLVRFNIFLRIFLDMLKTSFSQIKDLKQREKYNQSSWLLQFFKKKKILVEKNLKYYAKDFQQIVMEWELIVYTFDFFNVHGDKEFYLFDSLFYTDWILQFENWLSAKSTSKLK